MTKLTPDKDHEFTREWEIYTSSTIMAKKYGVNPRTIIRHAAKLGLSPRLGPRKAKKHE
jgi:hypothetical protein